MRALTGAFDDPKDDMEPEEEHGEWTGFEGMDVEEEDEDDATETRKEGRRRQ